MEDPTHLAVLRHLVTRTLLWGLMAEVKSCAWLANVPVAWVEWWQVTDGTVGSQCTQEGPEPWTKSLQSLLCSFAPDQEPKGAGSCGCCTEPCPALLFALRCPLLLKRLAVHPDSSFCCCSRLWVPPSGVLYGSACCLHQGWVSHLLGQVVACGGMLLACFRVGGTTWTVTKLFRC